MGHGRDGTLGGELSNRSFARWAPAGPRLFGEAITCDLCYTRKYVPGRLHALPGIRQS